MIDLDQVEDRYITASKPRASRSDLVDSLADVSDLISEVQRLRVTERKWLRLQETHVMVGGVSLG